MNNGICELLPDLVYPDELSFRCDCDEEFFYGEFCESKYGLCSNETCSSNGACVEEELSIRCECFQFYSGEHCEVKEEQLKAIEKVNIVSIVIAISFIVFFYAFFVFFDILKFGCGI
jgi:hypothetical protein